MKVITAKILDATHLELTQPIPFPTRDGSTIQISIPDLGEEEQVWLEATTKHFAEAYDEQDAIYDKLWRGGIGSLMESKASALDV